jgi:hypothetical protein
MNLLSAFTPEDRIIALIGMAKNSGKTVVFNQLITEAFECGLTLGITSIGRDGERQDLVTETPKPTIYAFEKTIIATAEALLPFCDAGLEILEVTGMHTALGRIIIGCVRHEGFVQVAGPSSNQAIRIVAEKMLAYGAGRVLIDGALDRCSSASPAIADCALLATGAILSRDISQVVKQTRHRIDLFQLPAVAIDSVNALASKVVHEHQVALIGSKDGIYKTIPLELKTALGTGPLICDAVTQETTHIVIGGSLVYRTLKEAMDGMKHPEQVVWIVQDATKLFLDSQEWQLLKRQGLQLEVIRPLKLVAVTVNPYSPTGYFFNPEHFMQEMSACLKGIPVVDVVYGGWLCNL